MRASSRDVHSGYLGYLSGQVAVGGGGGQSRQAQARLVGAEGGWRLDERWRVAKGAEPPLLGEELLVGHGVGEGEGRAGEQTLVGHSSRHLSLRARPSVSPESSNRQVSVGAAGGGAGPRVVDVGDQRTGRGADHRLQVDASVRQRRDGQRSLPAQPGRQPGAGKTRHCGQTGEFNRQVKLLTKLTQDVFAAPWWSRAETHTQCRYFSHLFFFFFFCLIVCFNVQKHQTSKKTSLSAWRLASGC